MEEQTETTSLL